MMRGLFKSAPVSAEPARPLPEPRFGRNTLPPRGSPLLVIPCVGFVAQNLLGVGLMGTRKYSPQTASAGHEMGGGMVATKDRASSS